jgi:two-component sensor histidine kinase
VAADEDFLLGDGEMGAAIRAFPWEKSALGPASGWPSVLKTTVATMLDSRFPQCVVWGDGLVTIPNDAFLPILGDKPDALGRAFSDVWAEVWADIAPIAAAALRGEATFIEDFALEVDRGAGLEPAWFTFCYSPIRDEHGVVRGMLDTVVETTGTVRAHSQARLLADELAHRMKNTLAVFQSIAHQTFRAHQGEAAHHLLDQRLAALSAAHDVLTQSEWAGAPLREVVEGALAPHVSAPDRIALSGPPVPLGGRQALSLALVVNELATNALKYGALSAPGGQIGIEWEADLRTPDGAFLWRWRERGGPQVAPPTRRGFGSRLIERVLPADFGGTVDVDYRAEGFALELRGRTDRLTDSG